MRAEAEAMFDAIVADIERRIWAPEPRRYPAETVGKIGLRPRDLDAMTVEEVESAALEGYEPIEIRGLTDWLPTTEAR